jgi:hypothetical protein
VNVAGLSDACGLVIIGMRSLRRPFATWIRAKAIHPACEDSRHFPGEVIAARHHMSPQINTHKMRSLLSAREPFSPVSRLPLAVSDREDPHLGWVERVDDGVRKPFDTATVDVKALGNVGRERPFMRRAVNDLDGRETACTKRQATPRLSASQKSAASRNSHSASSSNRSCLTSARIARRFVP